MQQTLNNRRVIWESKQKQVGLIAINFLFVAGIIWSKEKSSSFSYWGALIFFGGGGLFFLVRLLNPKNIFVTHNMKLGKELMAEQFREEQESLGFFTYTDNGFNLREHYGVSSYRWSDIETIFGFKEDRFTTDEICMDIITTQGISLRLTESTPGWSQFQKRISENFPAIPVNWDIEIAVPPFETKLTLLFDRKGRIGTEAEKDCYPE